MRSNSFSANINDIKKDIFREILSYKNLKNNVEIKPLKKESLYSNGQESQKKLSLGLILLLQLF